MIGTSFEANEGDKKLVQLVQFTLTTLYLFNDNVSKFYKLTLIY